MRPICGQCLRSQRYCPGPVTGVRFVDGGPNPPQTFNCVTRRTGATTKANRVGESAMVLLQEKSSRYGAFQKMRLLGGVSFTSPGQGGNLSDHRYSSDIERPIPATLSEGLAARLVSAMKIENLGYNVLCFGNFFQYVPAMLDRNHALYNAVSCCLDAHGKLLKGDHSREIVDLNLYGNALGSLKEALAGPGQSRCMSTLYAAAILQRIEVSSNLFFTGQGKPIISMTSAWPKAAWAISLVQTTKLLTY
jgi:hypothetical protein